MGDMGEFYKDTKELRKDAKELRKEISNAKKDRNLCNAIKLLDKELIPYEVKNNGIHFVIDSRLDYWPTTGKFIDRQTKKSGRGIFNLLKIIKGKVNEN